MPRALTKDSQHLKRFSDRLFKSRDISAFPLLEVKSGPLFALAGVKLFLRWATEAAEPELLAHFNRMPGPFQKLGPCPSQQNAVA
jgi:hypothetical protein